MILKARLDYEIRSCKFHVVRTVKNVKSYRNSL